MRVLSLFDGDATGLVALKKVGIKVEAYYASEIKKIAIKTAKRNHPEIIHIGDVRGVKGCDLPKIDLVIFGSPCQDMSRAKRNKSGLKGDKSSLFWEAKRILEETKPPFFLMENVAVSGKDLDAINQALGVSPVSINSSLVSAQSRERFYWTNIGVELPDLFSRKTFLPQPRDRGIRLQDILESGYTDLVKARCLLRTGGGMRYKDQEKKYRRYKSLDWRKGIRDLTITELERLQTLPAGYLSGLTYEQAVDLAGDGWTVDVIAHIFSFLPAAYKDCLKVIDENFMELLA
jgi:DNA (cytosine-5)-methyltransferase 3A